MPLGGRGKLAVWFAVAAMAGVQALAASAQAPVKWLELDRKGSLFLGVDGGLGGTGLVDDLAVGDQIYSDCLAIVLAPDLLLVRKNCSRVRTSSDKKEVATFRYPSIFGFNHFFPIEHEPLEESDSLQFSVHRAIASPSITIEDSTQERLGFRLHNMSSRHRGAMSLQEDAPNPDDELIEFDRINLVLQTGCKVIDHKEGEAPHFTFTCPSKLQRDDTLLLNADGVLVGLRIQNNGSGDARAVSTRDIIAASPSISAMADIRPRALGRLTGPYRDRPSRYSMKIKDCFAQGRRTIEEMRDCAGVWVTPKALALCAQGAYCPAFEDTVDGRRQFENALKDAKADGNGSLEPRPSDMALLSIQPASLALCMDQNNQADFLACAIGHLVGPDLLKIQQCLNAGPYDKQARCLARNIDDGELRKLAECASETQDFRVQLISCLAPERKNAAIAIERCIKSARGLRQARRCLTTGLEPAHIAFVECWVAASASAPFSRHSCLDRLGTQARTVRQASDCLRYVGNSRPPIEPCLTRAGIPDKKIHECSTSLDVEILGCFFGYQPALRAAYRSADCIWGSFDSRNLTKCNKGLMPARPTEILGCAYEARRKSELLDCITNAVLPENLLRFGLCHLRIDVQYVSCVSASPNTEMLVDCARDSKNQYGAARCLLSGQALRELSRCFGGVIGRDCLGSSNAATRSLRAALQSSDDNTVAKSIDQIETKLGEFAQIAASEARDKAIARFSVELNDRMQFWQEQVFYCKVGTDKYPSKRDVPYDPLLRYDPAVKQDVWEGNYESGADCDDGDMTFFNGLLCASGEEAGCAGAALAQAPSGRWWRSKRRIDEPDTDKQASFSTDQARGLYAYFVKTADKPKFETWLKWIEKNPRTYNAVLPSYCTHKECVFKAIDCPLLLTVAAAFDSTAAAMSVCNPLKDAGIPSPDEIAKEFEEAMSRITISLAKYDSEFRKLIDKLGGDLGFPPASKLLPSPQILQRAWDDSLRAYRAAREELTGVVVGEVAARQAQSLAWINAQVNSVKIEKDGKVSTNNPGPQHLVGVSVFVLRNLGYNSVDLEMISHYLWTRDKDNPFFEYLAHGRSRRMIELTLEKCPSRARPSVVRYQWFPERGEDLDPNRKVHAWEQSMYWDCIFLGRLWRDGVTSKLSRYSVGTNPLNDALDALKQLIGAAANSASSVERKLKALEDRLNLPVPLTPTTGLCLQPVCPPAVNPVKSYCKVNKCPKF